MPTLTLRTISDMVAGRFPMDLDIIRKIKFPHLKANFTNLALKHKFFLIVFLVSLIINLLPHTTLAQVVEPTSKMAETIMVFDTTNTEYQNELDQLAADYEDELYRQKLIAQVHKQKNLIDAVKKYLTDHSSPLASYASTLVTLKNWKKIVALSNAESTMCRKYPEATANCWGVGGANLWDMGSNLGEGMVAMNNFLNNYPKNHTIKYTSLTFEQMNGLYKQPAAQHWVDNNQIIYDELVAIENSIQ